MNLDYEFAYEFSMDDKFVQIIRENSQEMRSRRRKVVLPNGQIIFICGRTGCKATVGSVLEDKEGKRFKINLSKPALKGKVFDEYNFDNSASRQLGGKCRCGCVHQFDLEEVAQILGFADCEEALTPFLRRGKKVADANADVNSNWFVRTYVLRKDENFKGFLEFTNVYNPFYTDGSPDWIPIPTSSSRRPISLPIDDNYDSDCEESDPFADED